LKFDYAYHITVDGKVVFLGTDLKIQMVGAKDTKEGKLVKIGPKGIYVSFQNLMNPQFLNFNNIAAIEEV
jgi:hypothetical protein